MNTSLITRVRDLVTSGTMTKAGLARAAGLHANTLRDCTEDSWNPTAETLAKLETFLDANADRPVLATIEEIRAIRPGLENRVLINRFNRSSGRQNRYIELLSEHVPLTRPFLTLRVAVSDALDEGLPVWRFHRADRETRETWKRLCGELIHG